MSHKTLTVAPWLIATIGMMLSPPLLLAAAQDEAGKAQMKPEQAQAAVQRVEQGDFSEKGADTCLTCHANAQILPIFKTKHGNRADPRSPMAGLQCEACHGPSGEHVKAMMQGKMVPPPVTFGPEEHSSPQQQNRACLQCHENHERIDWKGSVHEQNEVSCAQCHKVHVAHDPVLSRQTQPTVCYDCHPAQRAQFYYSSHHPVREGKMACSACHNVHGGDGSELLVKATAREKCTSCHAQFRGPFLWEHAPAAEDCGLCHRPHGSNQPDLLTQRPPFLCEQCHSEAGHPSDIYNGEVLNSVGDPLNRRSRFMLIKGCLNCHSQVHGSNHPSGVALMR
jgi:DmsE family decaheme c-type cytochrome